MGDSTRGRKKSWRVTAGLGLTALLILGALAPIGSAEAELTTAVHRTDGVEGAVVAGTSNVVPAHVWDIQAIDNTMYVAGRFLDTVAARGSWPRHDQPFLAAFDATSGHFIDWWRPRLNGPVWSLEVSASGALLAAGDFTEVNGQARQNLVALDPRSGEIDPSFHAEVERPWTDVPSVIRDLHRFGDHLYLVGNFSHVKGGDPNSPLRTQVTKAARVDARTGLPDVGWKPTIAGRSAWAVAVSSDGQRVHLGGNFSYVNAEPGTALLATVDAQSGANVAGWRHGSNVSHFSAWPEGGVVYDLGVHGDNLFIAGGKHYWEMRDSRDGRSLRMVIENSSRWYPVGDVPRVDYQPLQDTQSIDVIGDRVYIGSHSMRLSPPKQIFEVNAITGEDTRNLGGSLIGGDGAWTATMAPDGCLWTGGDFRSTTQLVGGSGTSWVGRIARLCDSAGPLPHDVPSLEPPPAPGELVGQGAEWRWWADGTHPPGWTEPGFTDDAWAVGPARLGFGGGDEATVIPQIGADGRRILSALFRHRFEVPDRGTAPYLELRLNVDDGATVWLNGQPMVAQNVASGTIDAATYAQQGVWGAARRQFQTYRISSDALVAGTNLLAVSVHQNYRNSPQLTLEAQLAAVDDPGDGLTAPPDISVPTPPPADLVAEGSTWRYLDDGSDQATAWRQPDFDDSAWGQGPAKLGFAQGDVVTVTRDGGRPVTAWFRHRFTVEDPERFDELLVRLLRDDGAVVHLNGVEILRDNLPDGPVDHETNALEYVTGGAQSRFVEFTVPADALRSGENVLAVSVHQAPGSLDLGFDLALAAR